MINFQSQLNHTTSVAITGHKTPPRAKSTNELSLLGTSGSRASPANHRNLSEASSFDHRASNRDLSQSVVHGRNFVEPGHSATTEYHVARPANVMMNSSSSGNTSMSSNNSSPPSANSTASR